mmetsp:Transcript_12314/g.8962  ORF Transcript_12314/g.8962 Transcript_12314/m.8962 type:complete len:135 (+) Transcript_12314:437-841(+)
MMEVELMAGQMEHMKEFNILKRLSPTRAILHAKMKLPFPMSDREQVFMFKFLWIEQFKCFLHLQRSVYTPVLFGVTMPAETKDHVRVDLKMGMRAIFGDGASGIKIKSIQASDPRLNAAPKWFMKKMIEKGRAK